MISKMISLALTVMNCGLPGYWILETAHNYFFKIPHSDSQRTGATEQYRKEQILEILEWKRLLSFFHSKIDIVIAQIFVIYLFWLASELTFSTHKDYTMQHFLE